MFFQRLQKVLYVRTGLVQIGVNVLMINKVVFFEQTADEGRSFRVENALVVLSNVLFNFVNDYGEFCFVSLVGRRPKRDSQYSDGDLGSLVRRAFARIELIKNREVAKR